MPRSRKYSAMAVAAIGAADAFERRPVGGGGDDDHVVAAFEPSSSRTSRPRSPISPTTMTSASAWFAICSTSTLLPQPAPAKMPTRWPRPHVNRPSMTRTPVSNRDSTSPRWSIGSARPSNAMRWAQRGARLAVERDAERVDETADQRVADRDRRERASSRARARPARSGAMRSAAARASRRRGSRRPRTAPVPVGVDLEHVADLDAGHVDLHDRAGDFANRPSGRGVVQLSTMRAHARCDHQSAPSAAVAIAWRSSASRAVQS